MEYSGMHSHKHPCKHVRNTRTLMNTGAEFEGGRRGQPQTEEEKGFEHLEERREARGGQVSCPSPLHNRSPTASTHATSLCWAHASFLAGKGCAQQQEKKSEKVRALRCESKGVEVCPTKARSESLRDSASEADERRADCICACACTQLG